MLNLMKKVELVVLIDFVCSFFPGSQVVTYSDVFENVKPHLLLPHSWHQNAEHKETESSVDPLNDKHIVVLLSIKKLVSFDSSSIRLCLDATYFVLKQQKSLSVHCKCVHVPL